jgi:hypothetical protein
MEVKPVMELLFPGFLIKLLKNIREFQIIN